MTDSNSAVGIFFRRALSWVRASTSIGFLGLMAIVTRLYLLSDDGVEAPLLREAGKQL